MAFNLNFGYQNPNPQMDFLNSNYAPITGNPIGTQAQPVNADPSMMARFSSWLGGDTGRSLFGGTDPTTGFQSTGIVSPVISGLGALFQGWSGMRGMDLAKDQLNFQKQAYQTNLEGSAKAYNTALEDRIRGRTSDYAGKEADVQRELEAKRMNV
ncbi:MAG: hypothetical protein ACRDCE_08385 [Cetobacterium sp.]|uniref:hypothetical protein n=1 Tax=Cetobacterium sp. TaxID=2071632 RepID=UPI003EE68D82